MPDPLNTRIAEALEIDGAAHVLDACISSSNWTLSERVEARRALAFLKARAALAPEPTEGALS